MKRNRNRLVPLRLLCVVLAVTMLFLSAGCQTTPAPEEPPVSSEEGVSSLPESTPAESEEVSEIPAESMAESIPSKAEEKKPAETAPPSQEEPPKELPDKAEIIQLETSQTFLYQEGDWIYYRQTEQTTWYCRNIRTGQEAAFGIPHSFSRILFSSGDWLYCTNGYTEMESTDSLETLFRVKKDGSEVQEFKNTYGAETDKNQNPQLWGDWIYYGSRSGLYRISLDGNSLQPLAKIDLYKFSLKVCTDGLFVFQSYRDPYKFILTRYDLDGQNPTVLWEGTSLLEPSLLFDKKEHLYFRGVSQAEGKDELWRIHYNGTGLQRIAVEDEFGSTLICNKDWIYYAAFGSKGEWGIRRTHLNGSDAQYVVAPFKTTGWINFKIHGDYLYSDSGGALTRMELDGSNPILLTPSDENYVPHAWFVKDDIPYVVVHPRSQ